MTELPILLRRGGGSMKQAEIVAASSIYETDPWGVDPGQPNYLNQVVSLITPLSPDELARRYC